MPMSFFKNYLHSKLFSYSKITTPHSKFFLKTILQQIKKITKLQNYKTLNKKIPKLTKLDRYHHLTKKTHPPHIKFLQRHCTALNIPQKVINTAVSLYYRHIFFNDPDDSVHLLIACISIACKVLECSRSITDLCQLSVTPTTNNKDNISNNSIVDKERVFNFEYLLCIEKKFDINYYDPYTALQKYFDERRLTKAECKRAWVFMNDAVNLPVGVVFTNRVVVRACVLLAVGEVDDADEDVRFVVERIVEMYYVYFFGC